MELKAKDQQQSKSANTSSSIRLSEWAQWLEERQISLSFGSLFALLLAHGHTLESDHASRKAKLLALASYNPRTGRYAVGPGGDARIVLSLLLLLTGLRAAAMKLVLSPLAARWGVRGRKDAVRFAEQAWMLIYYNYLYYTSSYFLDMEALWTDWPQREVGGLMKFYTLAQLAFWMQQVLVIHLEQRRKDHWQMLGHHVVTIALIVAEYAYHQTRVGNLIMVLMDVIDLFLPLAKCLKYLGFTWICDVLFGFFVLSWVLARHVLFVITCWSVYSDLPRVTPDACYRGPAERLRGPLPVPDDPSRFLEPFVDPSGMVCFTKNIAYGFLAFLLSLQLMMVVWFTFIVKIILKILKGERAEDVRSDTEEDEDDGEDELGDGKSSLGNKQ
ncbi:TRAM1-like protein & fumonisin [Cordyceps javanica]|uniref:TRAM1-like protein & fumonisin n=1 Tax=Cordyceps javanica TaxID=43265 RepID=A0A545VPT5_9HYPO|nr:TRAM1-like protein & fumonisin [Cordyceps javanica]TQW03706.1 TRAM1-like protein & fumonisin [Cordyceps javanica]